MAFFRIEDERERAKADAAVASEISDYKADVRHAELMALFVNIYRRKGVAAVRPAQFLPKWAQPEEPAELTDEELLAKVQVINATLGGRVKRGKAP